MTDPSGYVRWFNSLRLEDVPFGRGRECLSGRAHRELSAQGIHVPNGFALTAGAYRDALTASDTWPRLHTLLDGLDVTDVTRLGDGAAEARGLVYTATGTTAMRRENRRRIQKA